LLGRVPRAVLAALPVAHEPVAPAEIGHHVGGPGDRAGRVRVVDLSADAEEPRALAVVAVRLLA
jgi:hypothetical protein